MKKIILSLAAVLLVFGVNVSAQQSTGLAGASYYVRANGNDSNAGTSENAPFATLQKAIDTAVATPVKKITVIGTLNSSVTIRDSGAEEILITGKLNAREHEKAVLVVLNQIVLQILGNSKIRLENITLQGKTEANNVISQGIAINGAEAVVTLANNTLITQFASTDGAGVFLRNGKLYMTGNATIAGNIARSSGGGIYMSSGTLIMDGNSVIRDNESRSTRRIDAGGGGIFLWSGTIELKGNSLITGNKARVSGGGIYCAGSLIIGGVPIYEIDENESWSHTFESGNIHGNSAENGPDVYEMYG